MSKSKPKKIKKSSVTVRTNRDGSIVVKAHGPNAPDLRDVIPGLFAGTRKL